MAPAARLQGNMVHPFVRRLHAEGNWRGLVVTDAWALDGIFGGYEGQLDNAGGRDRYVTGRPARVEPVSRA